jgi:hypothetical protein
MTATETEYDFSAMGEALPSNNVPPDYDPPRETDALTCTEPGCSTPLSYGGRGRKPTKCAIHKRGGSKPGAPKRLSGRGKAKGGTDYRPGILGLIQLPAGVLAIAGLNKPELAADAATLTVYAPGIAEAVNDLANERPEIAAVLDRVLAVGPYGALIAAVAPMALQILCNHDVVPSGILGTVPKEALFAHMEAERKAQEEQLKAAMG